jgi:hypothetical protein
MYKAGHFPPERHPQDIMLLQKTDERDEPYRESRCRRHTTDTAVNPQVITSQILCLTPYQYMQEQEQC